MKMYKFNHQRLIDFNTQNHDLLINPKLVKNGVKIFV
jgi:hypothetical protein